MNVANLQSKSIVEKDHFDSIVDILLDSGIILYPMDTCWGIGCDATNPVAVERIFNLKKRDRTRPFSVLVKDLEMLKEYAENIHPRLETLHLFHTRPLTVIYPKGINLPVSLLGKKGSVAIRIAQDSFCQRLISALGRPLVATSANISADPYPTNFGEISSYIIQGVDYVAKHRRKDKTLEEPAVVISYDEEGELTFLRD